MCITIRKGIRPGGLIKVADRIIAYKTGTIVSPDFVLVEFTIRTGRCNPGKLNLPVRLNTYTTQIRVVDDVPDPGEVVCINVGIADTTAVVTHRDPMTKCGITIQNGLSIC